MGRILQVAEPACLVLPPAVLGLCAYFRVEHTALLTLLAAIFSVLPFFLRFERQRPRPRDMMPIVVLAAIAAAGRILFAPFPNFKPVSAIVILSGACFGRQAGFLTGALAALASNMFFGQGPWTPWQMYAWGLIGFLAGILGRSGILDKPFVLYPFGFFSAMLYGFILDSWTVIGFLSPLTWRSALAGYATGLPFSLSHGIATAVFLMPLYKVWKRKINRIQDKFGLVKNESKPPAPCACTDV